MNFLLRLNILILLITSLFSSVVFAIEFDQDERASFLYSLCVEKDFDILMKKAKKSKKDNEEQRFSHIRKKLNKLNSRCRDLAHEVVWADMLKGRVKSEGKEEFIAEIPMCFDAMKNKFKKQVEEDNKINDERFNKLIESELGSAPGNEGTFKQHYNFSSTGL